MHSPQPPHPPCIPTPSSPIYLSSVTRRNTHTFTYTIVNKFAHAHTSMHAQSTNTLLSLTHSLTYHAYTQRHSHTLTQTQLHTSTHPAAYLHTYTQTYTQAHALTQSHPLLLSGTHTSASQTIAGLRHQTRCRNKLGQCVLVQVRLVLAHRRYWRVAQ